MNVFEALRKSNMFRTLPAGCKSAACSALRDMVFLTADGRSGGESRR